MLPPPDPHQLEAFINRLRDNGWTAVPLAFGSKQPVPGVRWKNRTFNGTAFAKIAHRVGPVGIGLRLDGLIATDIDADDQAEAERIAQLAHLIIGPTPAIRVGREPRRQLIYRDPSGTLAPWREQGLVECLTGKGAYVVGFNLHPDTGRPYVWIGEGCPLDLLVNQLPIAQA